MARSHRFAGTIALLVLATAAGCSPEVFGTGEIEHAFRFTTRATNGYV